MTTMTDSRAVEVLAAHNEWRRGGDGQATDPTTLGLAIDHAIARLREPVDAQVPSYDALLIIAQSVCGALERAGITDCDDPGEAIDVLRERYEAQAQGGGEVVYQIENDPDEWFDVERAIYEGHDGSRKRILYTAPPSAPAAQGSGEVVAHGFYDPATGAYSETQRTPRWLPAVVYTAPPSAPDVAMEAWHSAVDNAAELRANAPDERYAKRAASVESWIKAKRPAPPSAPVGVEKPLPVFSAGTWTYENGQEFSGEDLDGAAFAVYRDHLAQQPAAVDGADARDAEIEALRAEVLGAVGDAMQARAELKEWQGAAEVYRGRAERLAEVLKEAEEYIDPAAPSWYGPGQRILKKIRALLRDQEEGK